MAFTNVQSASPVTGTTVDGSGVGVGPSHSTNFGKNTHKQLVLNEVAKTAVKKKVVSLLSLFHGMYQCTAGSPFQAANKENELIDIIKHLSVQTMVTTITPQQVHWLHGITVCGHGGGCC